MHTTVSPPVSAVVLLPGQDHRVLGTSARTRSQRVAERAGAAVITPQGLADIGDEPAVLVPPDTMIEVALFPLPALTGPTWLVSNGAKVLAGRAGDLQPYVANLAAARDLPQQEITARALGDLSTSAARRRTAWAILLRTGKPTDGWVSRHCTRPLSRPISFVMLGMGLRAIHGSILTLLVGLGSAAFALQPGYLPLVGAGTLFQFASVLDGVDGEMARATLSESDAGALVDTLVDTVTYVVCFVGVTIGWFREGAGVRGFAWLTLISAALVFSLVRGGRFVKRYAPNASFVFIDRSVRRAARDTGLRALRVAAAMFTLLRRDAFATVFLFVTLAGRRALIPTLVAMGVVVANVTMSWYRRELAAAAIAEETGS